MKYIKYYITSIFVASFPVVAFATTSKKLSDVIALIAGYLNQILALLMGLAVVMFVYYVVKYFIQPIEVKRSEAAQYVMWSLLGFFVILSMWGLVNILISTFDLGQGSSPGSWTNINNLFPR